MCLCVQFQRIELNGLVLFPAGLRRDICCRMSWVRWCIGKRWGGGHTLAHLRLQVAAGDSGKVDMVQHCIFAGAVGEVFNDAHGEGGVGDYRGGGLLAVRPVVGERVRRVRGRS